MARFQPSSTKAPSPCTVDSEEKEEPSNDVAATADSTNPGLPLASTIQPISRSDVHRITSGQVILDIESAVKELVENSLDSGSTNVEVKFHDFGLQGLEVIDNGTGIKQQDWALVALPHHTSKIQDFDDLTSVATFGFRGEALASLCAHAEVTILTATKDEAPMGTLLEYDNTGRVIDSSKKLARQRGCTVTVRELFRSLPVRRRELEKNCRREYGKAQALLQAYALISKGVRWNSSNVTSAAHPASDFKKKSVALAISSANGPDFLMKNFCSLFGTKSQASLQKLELKLVIESSRVRARKRLLELKARGKGSHQTAKRRRKHVEEKQDVDGEDGVASDSLDLEGRSDSDIDSEDQNEDEGNDDDPQEQEVVYVTGLVSKPSRGSGRTSSDRQFLYINGRPWDNLKVTRAFNEIYRQFNTNQVPMLVADFALEGGRYDVNVSPDKRTIFIQEEQQLIEALKTALEDTFAPARNTLTVNGVASSTNIDLPLTQARLDLATQMPGTSLSPSQQSDTNAPPDENELALSEHSPALSARLTSPEDEETSPAPKTRSKSRIPPSPAVEATPSRTHANTSRSGSSSRRGCGSETTSVRLPQMHRDRTTYASASAPRQRDQRPAGVRYGASHALQNMLSRHNSSQPQQASPSARDLKDLEYAEDEDSGQSSGELTNFDRDADPAPHSAMQVEIEEREAEHAAERSEEHDVELDDDADLLRLEQHISKPAADDADDRNDRELNLQNLDAGLAETDTAMDGEVGGLPTSFVLRSGRIALDFPALAKTLKGRIPRASRKNRPRRSSVPINDAAAVDLLGAGIDNTNLEEAASHLERVITKADFAQMDILGQFNLGFIIARRTSFDLDDLFIIDQHAADEKFNFETLQAQTQIRSQRLIQPRLLELSATDELVASQHLDAIAANGFELAIDEEGVAGSRVHLIAQPVSKDTVFGVRDLEELLFHLRNMTPGSASALSVRCSKARAMFASRACRKSVMIGTALNRRQMTTVVKHMGTIEQPWNCPHGRPTMRHLACLRTLRQRSSQSCDRAIDWSRIALL